MIRLFQGCGYARFFTASVSACKSTLARANSRALPTFARAIRFRVHRFRILPFEFLHFFSNFSIWSFCISSELKMELKFVNIRYSLSLG